jgi:hypothetical protein
MAPTTGKSPLFTVSHSTSLRERTFRNTTETPQLGQALDQAESAIPGRNAGRDLDSAYADMSYGPEEDDGMFDGTGCTVADKSRRRSTSSARNRVNRLDIRAGCNWPRSTIRHTVRRVIRRLLATSLAVSMTFTARPRSPAAHWFALGFWQNDKILARASADTLPSTSSMALMARMV